MEWAIYGNIHNIFVDGYLKTPSASLTSANTADVYYGAAFTLLLYLFENYGGRNFIRELARQDLLGTRGINATFATLGRSTHFADVFQNWALANFVNDSKRAVLLGYENLPNRRVNGQIQQVFSYPTIRSDSLERWGVRYVVFQNLPHQLEIALDGIGDGMLHARIAHLPNNGASSIRTIDVDKNNNGRIELDNLKPADRVLLMVTATSPQSFRYAATTDASSGIVVGPPRPIAPSSAMPETTTPAIGSRSQPSQKRSNISYKLGPMTQVHLSSNYQEVAIGGERAYAVSDWGLEIFDLTRPTQPLRIGEIATPGNAQGIAVEDGFAYVADGAAGMHLIDVSQPSSPRLIKTVGDFDNAYRIHLANGNVYVVDNSKKGLKIFNQQEMQDAPNPKPIGTFLTVGNAYNVWVDGDTVYLSDDNEGVQILDFGRIDVPAIAGKVEIFGFDFQVVDGYAYVASGNLQIVDVRNRFKPEIISTVRTPGLVSGVQFRDGFVYLTDWQAGFYIVDVRNRNSPQIVVHQPTAGNATTVALFRTYAYIADGAAGLQVVDVSQPSQPRWLNHYDASGATSGMDIVTKSDGKRIAYIAAGRGGLKIVEIAEAFNATVTHHIPVDGFAAQVRVRDGYAFIAAGESGVIVIDLRDAEHPKNGAQIHTPEPAWGLEIGGGYAYVGAGALVVLDIRDPENSRVVAQRQMPGTAYRIALADGRAYVAALDGGVQLFDTTIPENPRAIGNYETEGNATDIAIKGERAYLLDSHIGVRVLDITDALRPVPIGTYQTETLPLDAQISGDHLYLLEPERVQIVDTHDFKLVSRFNGLRFASELTVIGDAVYVADLYDLRTFKVNQHLFGLPVDNFTAFGKSDRRNNTTAPRYINQLGQNFPNPFNPETWIPYEIAADTFVTIQIYDRHGTQVRLLEPGPRPAGRYTSRTKAAYWDGRNEAGEAVSSGLYFYRIHANTFTATRKMVIRK